MIKETGESLIKLKKKKKKKKIGTWSWGKYQSGLRIFYFFYFLDNFVLNTWISRKVSYFVNILHEVRDIFLSSCPQVLSLLNLWSGYFWIT